MVQTLFVVLMVWAVLSIVLGLFLAAVIEHADRRERAEVAGRVAAARASGLVDAGGSGVR